MTSLGTLGGNASCGYSINNTGQVMGISTTISGNQHVFVYSGGTMTELPTLGGTNADGGALNFAGQGVGRADIATPLGDVTHAFLYSGSTMFDLTEMIDLPREGDLVRDALDIYDRGQILVHTAYRRAYVLSPAPEPGTLTLPGAGVVASALFRRRAGR